ncbi:MAG TPA: hypothetical protein VJJ77_12825, partial [Dongiaceae bacterium]|nr:hypothetical protein [Dongiaceae bacterium]
AAIECEVVPVPPHGLPQTSSGKLSRSRAKDNYLRGVYAAAGDPESAPNRHAAAPLSAVPPGE